MCHLARRGVVAVQQQRPARSGQEAGHPGAVTGCESEWDCEAIAHAVPRSAPVEKCVFGDKTTSQCCCCSVTQLSVHGSQTSNNFNFQLLLEQCVFRWGSAASAARGRLS